MDMWLTEQAHKCPRCGTYDWEWQNGEHHWWADIWSCQGCADLDRVARQIADSPGNNDGKQVRLFSSPRE